MDEDELAAIQDEIREGVPARWEWDPLAELCRLEGERDQARDQLEELSLEIRDAGQAIAEALEILLFRKPSRSGWREVQELVALADQLLPKGAT